MAGEWKNKNGRGREREGNGMERNSIASRVLSVSIAKPWVGRLLARHREFVKSRVTRRWRCPAEKLGVRRQSLSGIYRFCGINRIPWDPPPCKRILQFMQGVCRTSSWWLERSGTSLSLSLSVSIDKFVSRWLRSMDAGMGDQKWSEFYFLFDLLNGEATFWNSICRSNVKLDRGRNISVTSCTYSSICIFV